MTLSDFATFSTAVSGLAVTASLIYLALQTHQSVKHTKALIHQGRAARMQEANLRMAEFDFPDGWEDCVAGKPGVSPRVLARYQALFRSGMYSAEDTFNQYRQGLLDKSAIDQFEGAVRNGMASKGYLMNWKLLRSSYSVDFREFVDQAIAKSTDDRTLTALERWNALAAETAVQLTD